MMHTLQFKRNPLIPVLAALAVPALAGAAAVPWENPDGSTANFTFSGGGSDYGVFGDPVVTEDGFAFTPDRFVAQAEDDGVDVAFDKLEFTLTANDGDELDSITVRELGDYAILGEGRVTASGGLFVFYDRSRLAGDDAELSFNPSFPIVATGGFESGNFEGSATIDLPDGVTSVTVVYNNILMATAGEDSIAFIQKKTAGLGFDFEMGDGDDGVIPEPASMALLGLAGLALRRRR